MKKLIAIIFAALVSTSCVIQRQPATNYITMQDIKARYGLTLKQCNEVKRAAYNGLVRTVFNPDLSQWVYDPDFDYSSFKKH